MDFGLSEEQEMLQQSAREFLTQECPPTFVRETYKSEDGFSRELHRKMAEMLVEPGAPNRADQVSRLQHRPHPAAGPAVHQTEMSTVLARQELQDRVRFPVPPGAEHDPFVGPLHGYGRHSLGNSIPISR